MDKNCINGNCNHKLHIAGAVAVCSVCNNWSVMCDVKTKLVCRKCEYDNFARESKANKRDRIINEILGYDR